MDGQLENLTELINKFKGKLAKDERAKLNTDKNDLNTEIAELAYKILLVLRPVEIQTKLSDTETVKCLVKCLNSAAAFDRRVKMVAKLINDPQVTQNEEWKSLKEYSEIIAHFDFEHKLSDFGIVHVPLIKLIRDPKVKTRIIYTDVTKSLTGFKVLKHYLDNNSVWKNEGFKNLSTLRATGPEAIAEREKTPANPNPEFEIAWGHIMNSGRHKDENIVFATSESTLAMALELSTPDSTFILDGHGSEDRLVIGRVKLMGKDLKEYIDKTVRMLGPNITHVILSSCATGCLTLRESNMNNFDGVMRQNKYSVDDDTRMFTHKNRKKVLISPNTNITDMFDKCAPREGIAPMESLAALFAKALFARDTQDPEQGTAFTFSPSLLIPDSVSVEKGGVIGVPAAASEYRLDWPKYHSDWEIDETGKHPSQNAFKSITLYSPNSRKALSPDGEWRRPRPTSKFYLS